MGLLFFFFVGRTFRFAFRLAFAGGGCGLLGFFHALGAGSGALFALGFLDLLRAQELDENLLGAIAALMAKAHDAEVSAFAIAEARAPGIEQTLDRRAGHRSEEHTSEL